jgi:RNAse (barnase) inhibitor barstar
MLAWFEVYFKSYPEHDVVNIDDLGSLIKLKSPKLTKEQSALWDSLLKQLHQPITPEAEHVTISAIEERRLAKTAEMLCRRYDDGEEIDIIFELNKLAHDVKQAVGATINADWCDTDVWTLIQADADDAGYVFDFLPEEFYTNVKGANEGNNICVAAPTDKGKTSFLVRTAVSFAKQRIKIVQKLKDDLKRDDLTIEEREIYTKKSRFRPVLYLVNEGTAEVITPRVYQTALDLKRDALWELGASNQITPKYMEIMDNRRDYIRLVNIHGKSVSQVARIIEAHDPFCVITDMTGRIRCNGGGNGANDVAQLEEVWNDFRVLAATMNFLHIGTAQISAEGFDLLYPPVSALQNSKTGIQTTLDLALWIGAYASPTPDNELMRGVSTPKNKLVKTGCRSYNTTTTFFEPETNDWDNVI